MATGGEGERNCITVLWRIENIIRFDEEIHGKEILSPYLYDSNNDATCYCWTLYPRGESEEDKNISLSLLTHPMISSIDIECSLLRRDGSPLVTRTLKDRTITVLTAIPMPEPPTHEEVFVTRKHEFLHRDTLTVRCRIWKSEGNFEASQFTSACSRIEVSEACFRFPVGKLSERETRRWVEIPGEKSLELICTLKGDSQQNYGLSFRLKANKMNNSWVMELKVSLIDDGRRLAMLFKNIHTFAISEKKQTWDISDFKLKDVLSKRMALLNLKRNFSVEFHITSVRKDIPKMVDKKYYGKENLEIEESIRIPILFEKSSQTDENFIGNDSFELEKSLSIPTLFETSCQTDQLCCDTQDKENKTRDSISALVKDFQSLHCKQNSSDFKLRSGDVSFPVHKNVLSARSPVFEAMFSSDMKESGTDSTDIPDLDCHTLNRMLTFLYTGTLEQDLEWESAAKLYYAADKYPVDTLKRECSSILKSGTSVSNVSGILTLAHKHQDEDLTSFVHDFILSRFDEVMRSKEWDNFLETDPYLAGKSAQILYKRGNIILK